MTDYGHDLLFGTVLTPDATSPADMIELAALSEQLGLDLVSVSDHPYQPSFLDAWTALSYIAARTTRIHLFPNVANLPLRPPAGIARSIASLDALSDGRAELGLGAGGYWDAIASEGGPRLSPGQGVDALAEAITVIRALWTPGPSITYTGEHYHLHAARPGPPHPHDPAIWIGAIKPRMLRVTGTLADGWLPSASRVPPAQLEASNQIIDDAARTANRNPSDIRRLYNVPGTITTTANKTGFLHGPPRTWAEQLTELTLTHGVSGYLYPTDDADSIRRFAQDVVPEVRERVARERAHPARPTTSIVDREPRFPITAPNQRRGHHAPSPSAVEA